MLSLSRSERRRTGEHCSPAQQGDPRRRWKEQIPYQVESDTAPDRPGQAKIIIDSGDPRDKQEGRTKDVERQVLNKFLDFRNIGAICKLQKTLEEGAQPAKGRLGELGLA